jgi:hypothetical protein
MCNISCVLEGEDRVDFEDLKDLSVSDIECYKYARLMSCDVESTFLSTNNSSIITDTDLRCTSQR